MDSGIAAAVVVTFVSIVFFSLHHLPVASVVEKKVFSELTKQRDKYQAVLSIGENKKVILDGTEKKVVYADSNSRVIVNDDCEVHYEIKNWQKIRVSKCIHWMYREEVSLRWCWGMEREFG